MIVAHPWLALFLAGAPLLLLAWQATRLDTSLPRGNWLPPAGGIGARASRPGTNGSERHCVNRCASLSSCPDSIPQTDAGWNAIDRLTKRLASDPRCDRVISITTLAESNRSALDDLSRETRRTFLSSDGRAALIEVMPATSVSLRNRWTG